MNKNIHPGPKRGSVFGHQGESLGLHVLQAEDIESKFG